MTQRYEVEPCAHPDCDATVTMHGMRLLKRITELEAQLETSAALCAVAQEVSATSMALVNALKGRVAELETEVACKAGLLENLGRDASGRLSEYKWRVAEMENRYEKHDRRIQVMRDWIWQHQSEPGAAEHVKELTDALALI